MKAPVFEFKLPGVATVRVTGSNEGRYARYCTRIGAVEGDDSAAVDFEASEAGEWTLDGVAAEGGRSRHVRGRPCFYESTYQVRCNFAPEAGVTEAYVLHEMKSVADEFYFEENLLDGRFDFVNSPGQFTFEIDYVAHGKLQKLKLKWWVVSEKINVCKDVKTIKEVIEKENKGFVYSFLSQTKGSAGLSPSASKNNGEWLDIFRRFVEPYVKAVGWIVRSPHLRYQPEVEYVRADRVNRWKPQLVNRLKSMDRERQERTLFRVEKIRPKIDTPENRFVLFTLKKISARLGDLAGQCRKSTGVAERYAKQVEDWKKELERLAAAPFFRAIGTFDGLKQENLVLQRQRGYSKIFETWVALKHALDVTKSGLDAGNRPIWKLYEFWCYLAIRNYLVDRHYEIDWTKSGLGSLATVKDVFSEVDPESDANGDERPDKGHGKCQYVFNDPARNRTITLVYQQSYSNAGSADHDDGLSAHLVEQIPDIVMTIRENGGGGDVFTYLFDAKYRIMSWPSVQNPEKDAAPYKTINEMHRYRDAILYRRQKEAGADKGRLTHEIIGAYVLYPGRADKSFDYKPYIDEENIGAIPLLPGEGGDTALRKYLTAFIDYPGRNEHLGGVIPTRGTTAVVGEGFSEETIPTFALEPNEMPSLSEKAKSVMKVPLAKEARITKMPTLVRLKSNNTAEVIVKVKSRSGGDKTHGLYEIEWTPEGSM